MGSAGDPVSTRRRLSAATTSLLFVLLVVMVALALQIIGWVTATTDEFAETPEFRTWAGFGGMTAAIWAVAFLAGHFHVSDVAALAQDSERRKHPYRNYGGQAILLAVLVLALMLLLGGGGGFDVALGPWEFLRVVIPTLGIAAAVPWIITVWWTHDDLSQVRNEVDSAQVTESEVHAVDVADSRPLDPLDDSLSKRHETRSGHTGPAPSVLPQHQDQLRRLLDAWTSIERSTGALATIVSVGALTTGALRLAIEADRSDEPAGKVPTEADVLAYGLFFAALVAAVVVPLILSYRRRAQGFLDVVYLPENRVAESEEAATLAELLHLDTSPLVSPWALISVVTPVVASALAVYLPGIGG